MKRRIIVFIILAIAVLSSMSLFSLLLYFDPYTYKTIALILLCISFIGSFGGYVTLILYFIKKIYFRGDVGIFHILSSMRQAFFVSSTVIGTIYILALGIPMLIPTLLIIIGFVFLELFIQNL